MYTSFFGLNVHAINVTAFPALKSLVRIDNSQVFLLDPPALKPAHDYQNQNRGVADHGQHLVQQKHNLLARGRLELDHVQHDRDGLVESREADDPEEEHRNARGRFAAYHDYLIDS